MSTAVELFLSLDISQHEGELRALTLAGSNPDQARDEHGRWTRIESHMKLAEFNAKMAMRVPQPPDCKEKELDKAHASVADASHEASIRGTAKSHEAAAEAAKTAAGKFERLSGEHSKAGNMVESKAAKRAAEDYRAIAAEHGRSASMGGDSQPHVGYVEPKPAAVPVREPEFTSPTENAFAAADKARKRGRDPQEAYRKAYPGSPEAEAAVDKARELSRRVKEDVNGEHTAKDDSTERMEFMVNAHRTAIDALNKAAVALPENSRRRKKSLAEAKDHEALLKDADVKLQQRRGEDAADGYTPKAPIVPPGDIDSLHAYYVGKKEEQRARERGYVAGIRRGRPHPALSSE